ncbi:hypothetical protein NQZ70_06748 [Sorangium sp. Soce836]|nr:hypothetical protein NQZ70_06748 [Sorangium sp. Soce836]
MAHAVMVSRLQWGRRLSAAEGSPPPSAPSSWPWGFNGAAAFQRRKLCQEVDPGDWRVVLQWGCRLSAVETAVARDRRAWRDRASMRPPPFSGGKHKSNYWVTYQQPASMGPPEAAPRAPGHPQIHRHFKHLPALRAPPGFSAPLHRSQPVLPPSSTTPSPPLGQPFRSPRPLCRSPGGSPAHLSLLPSPHPRPSSLDPRPPALDPRLPRPPPPPPSRHPPTPFTRSPSPPIRSPAPAPPSPRVLRPADRGRPSPALGFPFPAPALSCSALVDASPDPVQSSSTGGPHSSWPG